MYVRWAQLIEGGARPSPFAALAIWLFVKLVPGHFLYPAVCNMTTIARYCITEKHSMPHRMKLHGPSMFAIKAKIYEVLYIQSSSIAFDETSSYWPAPKNS